jgi:hypothetical protein
MRAMKLVQYICVIGLMFGLSGPVLAQSAKPMTNQDVIKMVQAKLPEDTISMAIRAAAPGFDTSADGLVKLSTAGVPQGVIKTILEHASGGASSASAGSAAPAAGGARGGAVAGNALNPEEVMLIDGGQQAPMRYLVPQMRSAARALGMGGVAQYAVLRGTAASLRLKNTSPSFLVAVPTNAQAESYVTVAEFAVRKNGTREVTVGGGYMSYSSGIAKDRVVPVNIEKAADQSRAPKDFVLYKVDVARALKGGEYAFILYNSQIKSVGFFASGNDSYFDFGVDN